MAFIQTFRDLQVYQLARKNTQRIFLITRSFPSEEKYCLVNQTGSTLAGCFAG
jgi:23S rRNA-intervening sequence protein